MPAAPYRALVDRAKAINDSVHAESVLLRFVRDGVGDPERPAIEIVAPLRVQDGQRSSIGGRSDREWNGRISAQAAILRVDRSVYPDIDVRVGDEVRAIDRPGQPWFEVVGIDQRGATRLVLYLGEAT